MKNRKKRRWAYPAYFTLEASLIVPMAICVIVLLIHLAYFTYQRALLTQDTYLLTMRAAIFGREAEIDADAYIQGNAADQFGKCYIGSPQPQLKVTDAGSRVLSEASTQADYTAMRWYELMPDGSLEVRARARADVIHKGNHVRRLDRIIDLGKQALAASGGK